MPNDFSNDEDVKLLYNFSASDFYADSIGDNPDLTPTGAPWETPTRGSGVADAAIENKWHTFNPLRASALVAVSDASLISYPDMKPISIAVWLYAGSGASSAYVEASKGGTLGDWAIIATKNGKVFFRRGVSAVYTSSPGAVALDAWSHYVWTIAENGLSRIQVRSGDGTLLINELRSLPSGIPRGSGSLRITLLHENTGPGTLKADELVMFSRDITSDEAEQITLGLFGPQPLIPSLATFPSERPYGYDPDLFWQPGEWTGPTTYVSPLWGSGYVATGGGRWGQNLVVCANKKIYYEPHSGV